ncbi:phosphatidylserine decarboxylase, partial ['Crotalaria aegyptiaca' phytoplasma]|nr:phosphatidylserine decarboxylase ['Crotalaria aegyptiaca' phytoplasma]
IFSRIHVKKIIIKNRINTGLFTQNSFKSYNDFFIRVYKKINLNQIYKIKIYRLKNKINHGKQNTYKKYRY